MPLNILTSNIPSAGQGLLSIKLCKFCNRDFGEFNIIFNARHISRLSPLPVVVLWILLIIRGTPIFFSKSSPCTLLYLGLYEVQQSMVTPIFFASPLPACQSPSDRGASPSALICLPCLSSSLLPAREPTLPSSNCRPGTA